MPMPPDPAPAPDPGGPDPGGPDPDPEPVPDPEPRAGTPGSTGRRRKGSVSQSIGGVLFGFEQQVWRTAPPPEELVRHARPDAPIPAADGTLVTISMPDDVAPDPFGGPAHETQRPADADTVDPPDATWDTEAGGVGYRGPA